MSLDNLLFIVGLVGLIFWVIRIYNQLVLLKNRYKNAFSQIDIQMKRRYDLIPNLVETAKAYMSHERETLEAVISARNAAASGLANTKAGDKQSIKALNQAEQQLSSAMGQFNLVMEAYPDLKASDNMMQLSEELTSTENKLAFSRQAYNDSVMQFNTYRQSFPNTLLAPSFGHPENAEFLEFEDKASIQVAPTVTFS